MKKTSSKIFIFLDMCKQFSNDFKVGRVAVGLIVSIVMTRLAPHRLREHGVNVYRISHDDKLDFN